MTESCIFSACSLADGGSGSDIGGAGIHSLPVHMNFPSGLYVGSTITSRRGVSFQLYYRKKENFVIFSKALSEFSVTFDLA
jgi:hypothetical protein